MSQHMSIEEWNKAIQSDKQTNKWWEDESPVIEAPVKKKRKHPEDEEDCKFADHLDKLVKLHKVLQFSHIANENTNKKRVLHNWKIGVRAGCPDFVIIIPPKAVGLLGQGTIPGKIVFIEMKAPKNSSASPEQKQWIAAITQAGGYATVAKGATAAIEYLEELL